MVRTYQTARKCVDRGPRKVLLCTQVEKQRSIRGSVGEEHAPCDGRRVVAQAGLHYRESLHYTDLNGDLLQHFNNLSGTLRHIDDLGELGGRGQGVENVIQAIAPNYELHRYPLPGETGDAYSLHAKRAIGKGEAVIAFTGKLYTRQDWEKKHPDLTDKEAHLWAYDMPARTLRETARGYRGPDLVLAADEERNESCYLQDSWWIKGGYHRTPDYNLSAEVVWTVAPAHPEQVLPYIVYFAIRSIKAGAELDIDWGDDCWEPLSQLEVMGQALHSWRDHYRLKRLQQHVDAARAAMPGGSGGGGGGAAGPSGGAGSPRTPAKAKSKSGFVQVAAFDHDRGYLTRGEPGGEGEEDVVEDLRKVKDRGTREQRLPPPEQRFRVLSEAEVRAVFPGYRKTMDFSGLPGDLVEEMDACQARKSRKELTREEERVLAAGDGLLAVAEILALHHPVRLATPPAYKAHTVLAATDMKDGQLIACYAGVMRVDDEDSESEEEDSDWGDSDEDSEEEEDGEPYGFDIGIDDLRRLSPDVNWPEGGLVVNAGQVGNASRFMNDVWRQHDSRELNVNAEVVWSRSLKRPVVAMYAVGDIKKGTELCYDYGNKYWRFHAKRLQQEHFKYHKQTRDAITGLEEWVKRHEGEARLLQLRQEHKVALAGKRLVTDE